MGSERQESSEKPLLDLSASAAHFDQETLDSAMEALRPHFRVGGGLRFELSELPPANVILEMALLTLQVIPANLISSTLFEVLRRFFLRPARTSKTSFSLHISDGSRIIDLHIETSDSDDLRSALASIPSLGLGKPKGNPFKFDAQDREWRHCDDPDWISPSAYRNTGR